MNRIEHVTSVEPTRVNGAHSGCHDTSVGMWKETLDRSILIDFTHHFGMCMETSPSSHMSGCLMEIRGAHYLLT